MILRAAAASDVGHRRKQNEDRYALAPELGLYVVADGMGGHTAGQVASELAAEASLKAIQTLDGAAATLTEKLRYAVASANRTIFSTAEQRPEYAGMGTTIVMMLAEGERAALAHVGDSRAYRVRAGVIRQLSDDHSIVGDLLRRNQISEDDAKGHPHRHVLTRALGVRESVEPDLAEISPALGDVFVLCSDGLTNHVDDHEIAKMATDIEDLQELCESFVDLANARGGEDNTTVIAARCCPST
ncbi:MAG: Stp1/IreP family PP2C-type Ser/Thr phosphatase [Deltaproteobacteria bacterium]|nr:Stp1/IreP family PP2C-type Ser/Thr phosphatase [Deltaproteobacteria bacterium]MBW2395067.1 Stp1/IreP family PP2C-type Ser/Thr phosphatase [Deltaproteobacteria bacterium]